MINLFHKKDNLIQKNIVLLNVFYNNMESTFVNEVAKVSPDMLFGDIGGNLVTCFFRAFAKLV
jgi:hypothetical protein